jgi:hypothetical protein
MTKYNEPSKCPDLTGLVFLENKQSTYWKVCGKADKGWSGCIYPFFEKLKEANLGQGFNCIDLEKEKKQGYYWREIPAAEKAFKLFKKLAFVVMKDKAKEQT